MRRLALAVLLSGVVWAQSPSMPVGVTIGAGVPVVNCLVGQFFFRTDAVAGNNLYLCTTMPNTWTLVAGTAGGSVTGSGTLNQLAKWTAATVLGDAGLHDNGTAITMAATRSMFWPNTTSATTGILFKTADRFLHDYKPAANDGFNTFLGMNAGNFTMSSATAAQASYNTGIGNRALISLTSGYRNTALGYAALDTASVGFQNTALGYNTLQGLGSSSNNTAVGYSALSNNVFTSDGNTAVGATALQANSGAGGANTAVGAGAAEAATGAAARLTAVGFEALHNNTTAVDNVAVGDEALFTNATGTNNTAVGTRAAFTTNADSNTVVGTDALHNNSAGTANTALGVASLYTNTGSRNSAAGSGTLFSQTSGDDNTVAGWNAGYTETPANANVTGDQNTWVGTEAGPGAVTQISNSIGVGYRAHPAVSNEAVIGNDSVVLTRLRGAVQWTTIAEGACNAANRGQVVYVAGGAGVADTFRICRKDGADAYAWTALF